MQENAGNENVQRVGRQKHIDISVHFRESSSRSRGGRIIRNNRFGGGYRGGRNEYRSDGNDRERNDRSDRNDRDRFDRNDRDRFDRNDRERFDRSDRDRNDRDRFDRGNRDRFDRNDRDRNDRSDRDRNENTYSGETRSFVSWIVLFLKWILGGTIFYLHTISRNAKNKKKTVPG